MNINKSICILALSAASVFASVSVHAIPTEDKKADAQKSEETKTKEQSEIELRLLLLSEDNTVEKFCPKWPRC